MLCCYMNAQIVLMFLFSTRIENLLKNLLFIILDWSGQSDFFFSRTSVWFVLFRTNCITLHHSFDLGIVGVASGRAFALGIKRSQVLLKSFYLAVATASLTSWHKTHQDPLDLLQRPKDPPCLLMQSTISRTPLVPEGGVPLEEGVDFSSTQSSLGW